MRLRTLVVVGGALVLAMVAGGAWALTQVPVDAQIPVHWGLDGTPDKFAPAWLGLFGVPAIAAAVLLLLVVVPRIEPRRDNLVRSFTAYVSMGIGILVVAGLIQVAVVGWAVGWPVDIGTLALVGVGGLYVVIGNFLGKTRSNWSMGIRTPWTLSSERSWTRTHRVGGLVFVAIGLVVIVATFVVGPQIALALMLGALALAIVGIVVYSYLVWRDDPDREPRPRMAEPGEPG